MLGFITAMIFSRNSNLTEISFCTILNFVIAIASNFFTCHDSIAVVACDKICSDLMAMDIITVNGV